MSGTTTVDWSVAGSGANPAGANDFLGAVLPSGTLTFASGEVSKVITVSVVGDTAIETAEGFTVTLSGANAPAQILLGGTATGTILNDDVAPPPPASDEELLKLYTGKGMKLLLAGNDLPMLTGAARAHQKLVRSFE